MQEINDLKKSIKKKKQLQKNLLNDKALFLSTLSRKAEAEILRLNFYALKKGLKQVDLIDYNKNPPEKITINLNPRLSPKQQLESLFNTIKKAKRGLAHIDPRLSEVAQNLIELEQQLAALLLLKADQTSESQDPKAIKSQTKTPKPRLPYRIYQSIDGIALWVGKSARDNDELTLRYTKGNEWWLHARGVTGSHVIIKSSDQAPKVETLLDAASLAIHHSKLKHEGRAEVSYTRVKYVRKAKGMPPGSVLVSQEKTLSLKMEPERLKRLLMSVA